PVTVRSRGHHASMRVVHTSKARSGGQSTSKENRNGAVTASGSGRRSPPAAGTERRRPARYLQGTPGPRAASRLGGGRSALFPAPARPPSRRPSAGGDAVRRQAG